MECLPDCLPYVKTHSIAGKVTFLGCESRVGVGVGGGGGGGGGGGEFSFVCTHKSTYVRVCGIYPCAR